MSSTDPKDPNAPVEPDAAVAAAEAALAQAKAAAAAAEAARARAVSLSKASVPSSEAAPPELASGKAPAVNLGKGKADKKAAPASKPAPEIDPLKVFAGTGGEMRALIGKQGRFRMSRVTIATAIAVFVVAVAAFGWLLSDSSAKARMDAALDGNSCGENGTSSCLTELVTSDKKRLERQWRENILRQKPIYGSLTLTYEPTDATIEVYQIAFRISPDEWKSGAKDLLGTAVKNVDGKWVPCTKDKDGKLVDCEQPYKAFENLTTGQCVEGQAPTTIPPLTGKPLIELQNWFIPLFKTEVSCENGDVTEAFNYEYRVVIQHKDFDPKNVYVSRSAWTPGLGSHTLEFPPLALVPKPEKMLDSLVKFRSELFCYMKKKQLTADKVPASAVDALRTQHGFVSIELYDRTEALLTTPEHKPWWDERLKEIEALKCEE